MHGASIMMKNASGWTPLAEAVSYGDRQISECCMIMKIRFQDCNYCD